MSWEAIRAFATEVQRREKEVVDSNDLNSNRWYYAKAITAAREAQALLLEYEAQSKRLNRAVELLQDVHSAFVYNNDIGIVELQCEVE